MQAFIGFTPSIFIINSLGSGLENIISTSSDFELLRSDNLNPNIYLPLICYFLILIVSAFLKIKYLSNFKIMKNNLIKDPSPYLQQHKNNPVHWQTWTKKTLDLLKKKKNQFY